MLRDRGSIKDRGGQIEFGHTAKSRKSVVVVIVVVVVVVFVVVVAVVVVALTAVGALTRSHEPHAFAVDNRPTIRSFTIRSPVMPRMENNFLSASKQTDHQTTFSYSLARLREN